MTPLFAVVGHMALAAQDRSQGGGVVAAALAATPFYRYSDDSPLYPTESYEEGDVSAQKHAEEHFQRPHERFAGFDGRRPSAEQMRAHEFYDHRRRTEHHEDPRRAVVHSFDEERDGPMGFWEHRPRLEEPKAREPSSALERAGVLTVEDQAFERAREESHEAERRRDLGGEAPERLRAGPVFGAVPGERSSELETGSRLETRARAEVQPDGQNVMSLISAGAGQRRGIEEMANRNGGGASPMPGILGDIHDKLYTMITLTDYPYMCPCAWNMHGGQRVQLQQAGCSAMPNDPCALDDAGAVSVVLVALGLISWY